MRTQRRRSSFLPSEGMWAPEAMHRMRMRSSYRRPGSSLGVMRKYWLVCSRQAQSRKQN